MALTRSMLKAMEIDADKIDQIIEAHADSIAGLKNERDQYRESAAKIEELERQLEEAKAQSSEGADEYRQQYEDEHKAFEAFKEQVANEKTAAEKRELYKQLLSTAGVDDKRVDAILKVTDLSDVAIEDGSIKDADKLAESIKDEWAEFIIQPKQKGAHVDNPPSIDQQEPEPKDLAQAMKQKYDRGA